jgi:hypothetical protein
MTAPFVSDDLGFGLYMSIRSVLSVERHSVHCEPGLWRVTWCGGSDLGQFVGHRMPLFGAQCVVDDFGNLVRVQ